MRLQRVALAGSVLLGLALCQGVNNSNSAAAGGAGAQGTAAAASGAWPVYLTDGSGNAVPSHSSHVYVQLSALGNANAEEDVRADSWGDGASNATQQLMAYAAAATWNGSGFDRNRSANAAAGTSGTGVPAAGLMGYDGTNWQLIPAGTKTAFLNFTASGSGATQIIALAGGKPIAVTGVFGAFAAATTVTLEYGTGSNCGTGTTTVSGTYPSIQSLALSAPNSFWSIPAGNALCVLLGANATGTVEVHYAQ